ncbi:SDR family NAD(P)-dependent oxidoreductase [Chachezhania sediminis]|uniref:SDR family NAD(P)-dependent oxidoreductase n=1 Tax=Chachezhania sediminis TaxID=2599291 RepID=UPI00131BE02F|nr:SDR family NAD(P)-dependent oxidoreductase [Chachezhania sediminis]
MTEPLSPPKRKDPLKRTAIPVLPPSMRSRAGQLLTWAAAEGRFALQKCLECGHVAYPPRDACPECLSEHLPLADISRGGEVVSESTIEISGEVYFRERAPWRIGMIKLDEGPIMVAHLHGDSAKGDRVRMSLQLDVAGNAAAFARPVKETPNMADDRQWRTMVADPKFRRILVTDGRAPVGRAVAKALLDAGAKTVWLGISEDWKPYPPVDPRVNVVPLTVDDVKSCEKLAGAIGGKVDILVNTGDYMRPGDIMDTNVVTEAREQLNRHFLGFLHLAHTFGGGMRARGADGTNSAVAWVNVLSAYALANTHPYGTYSAVQAACLSLSHSLRGEMRHGGVRVTNVFSGPVEDEWYQELTPPKVGPGAVASAIVKALREGQEDVYVGDFVKDLRERLEANPKGLEREMNSGG